MEKIASLEIPDGAKSIEVYKTPSGILIDFTRDNGSVKIGDVIVYEHSGKITPLYVVQNNKNPFKNEFWEIFEILNVPDKGFVPCTSEYRKIHDQQRIASERERLAFLWDIEHKYFYVWDENVGRMVPKKK